MVLGWRLLGNSEVLWAVEKYLVDKFEEVDLFQVTRAPGYWLSMALMLVQMDSNSEYCLLTIVEEMQNQVQKLMIRDYCFVAERRNSNLPNLQSGFPHLCVSCFEQKGLLRHQIFQGLQQLLRQSSPELNAVYFSQPVLRKQVYWTRLAPLTSVQLTEVRPYFASQFLISSAETASARFFSDSMFWKHVMYSA